MASPKWPWVIRRHAAASDCSGRVTAYRVSRPRNVAVAQNTTTMAISTRSRHSSTRRSSSAAWLRAAARSAFCTVKRSRIWSNSALPRSAVALLTTIGSAGGHARDQRVGIVCPPGGGRIFDRVQIRDQARVGGYSPPDLAGRRLFVTLPVVVRREELPICGDQVTAQARFLVAQRRLQLRRPRRAPAGSSRSSRVPSRRCGPAAPRRPPRRVRPAGPWTAAPGIAIPAP